MEYEIILQSLEAMGADAKWALIVYFLADAASRLGVCFMLCFTVYKVVKNAQQQES